MSYTTLPTFSFNDLGLMALRSAVGHENDEEVQHYILDEYEAALQRTAVQVERIKIGHGDDSTDLAFKRIFFRKLCPYIGGDMTECMNTLISRGTIPFSSMAIETFRRYYDRSIEEALRLWRSREFRVNGIDEYTIGYEGPGARALPDWIFSRNYNTRWGLVRWEDLHLLVEPQLFKACYDQMATEVTNAMQSSISNYRP